MVASAGAPTPGTHQARCGGWGRLFLLVVTSITAPNQALAQPC